MHTTGGYARRLDTRASITTATRHRSNAGRRVWSARPSAERHSASDDAQTMSPVDLDAVGCLPALTTLEPGTLIGDYLILRELAAGGCGTVYRARHRLLGRDVALKVVHQLVASSAVMCERLVREARALGELRHPNIVEVYDLGWLPDGRPFYIMELLDGCDLQCLLRREGRVGLDEAIAMVTPICGAVATIHAAGLVHRDLKASNVFVSGAPGAGGRRVIKVLDLGIAKVPGDEDDVSITSASARLGTPSAMAPEQIRGDAVDARTDVYALGVLLYHMLTGRLPFDGMDRIETERMHLETPAPRASQHAPVPQAIDAVILRAMDKSLERRQASAGEFLDELLRAARPDTASRTVARAATPPPVSATSAASAGGTARAVAIRVDARLVPQASNETIEQIADALERASEALRAHRFAIALDTADTVIAAQVLGGADTEGRSCRRARLLAGLIRDALARDLPAHDVFRVRVHVDTVQLSGDGAIAAGALLERAAWPDDDGSAPRGVEDAGAAGNLEARAC